MGSGLMPIDPLKLLNWQFEPVTHDYSNRDVILYALGIGLGKDPLNRVELKYVYEQQLSALPTFAVTLATLGMWVKNPDTGITWNTVVHSAQRSTFHTPLPNAAKVTGVANISQVWDRGPERGAVIVVEREIRDCNSGTTYCTLEQSLLLRSDGGFGGEAPPASAIQLPGHAPDLTSTFSTDPNQAIIYRLSGDWNPLHIDPDVALKAGFAQPILHGYCTYGISAWAACQTARRNTCELRQLECQFTGSVIPGDVLEFQWWQHSENEWLFRAKAGTRQVLNRGRALFDNQGAGSNAT